LSGQRRKVIGDDPGSVGKSDVLLVAIMVVEEVAENWQGEEK
jgi:hypothetical protein